MLSLNIFRSARNRYAMQIRRAKSAFYEQKMEKLTSSPTDKCFWSLAKKLSNNFCNSTFPPLICPDGSIACSPFGKANLFGSQFSSTSSLNDSHSPDPTTVLLSNPMPSPIISARNVWRVLSSLKVGKASGPDGIPLRFLIEFADELAPVLCRLFCSILKSCTSPSAWKHALVLPIPKKDDWSNPSNYRPIALTSTIPKVFKTLLNCHILKHFKSNSLLFDHQYGFHKARLIGDLLFYRTHVWSSSIRNFGEFYVVALDICKAFDGVWHKALLVKLPPCGFTSPLCNLIFSFLSVIVDRSTSATFGVSSGVQQRSVFSLILFLLCINDLLDCPALIHAFADNSTLRSSLTFSHNLLLMLVFSLQLSLPIL